MSDLSSLLTKPNSDLSDAELEIKINLLKRLRTAPMPRAPKSSTVGGKPRNKSNKERQLEDLLRQLSPEEIQTILKGLTNVQT